MGATTGWYAFEEPWFHLTIDPRAREVPTYVAAIHEQTHRASTVTRYGILRQLVGFATFCARHPAGAGWLDVLERAQDQLMRAALRVDEGLAVTQSLLACFPDYMDELPAIRELFLSHSPYDQGLRSYERALGLVPAMMPAGIDSFAGAAAALARVCHESDILLQATSLAWARRGDLALGADAPDQRLQVVLERLPAPEVLHDLWRATNAAATDEERERAFLEELARRAPGIDELLGPYRRDLRAESSAFVTSWVRSVAEALAPTEGAALSWVESHARGLWRIDAASRRASRTEPGRRFRFSTDAPRFLDASSLQRANILPTLEVAAALADANDEVLALAIMATTGERLGLVISRWTYRDQGTVITVPIAATACFLDQSIRERPAPPATIARRRLVLLDGYGVSGGLAGLLRDGDIAVFSSHLFDSREIADALEHARATGRRCFISNHAGWSLGTSCDVLMIAIPPDRDRPIELELRPGCLEMLLEILRAMPSLRRRELRDHERGIRAAIQRRKRDPMFGYCIDLSPTRQHAPPQRPPGVPMLDKTCPAQYACTIGAKLAFGLDRVPGLEGLATADAPRIRPYGHRRDPLTPDQLVSLFYTSSGPRGAP